MKGALYNGAGHPISDTPLPPLDGPNGLIHSRPVCHILVDVTEVVAAGDGVDLIYVLPLGPGPHLIEPMDLAELVACLDRGGRIALHADHEAAITAAVGSIMAMTGGGRA